MRDAMSKSAKVTVSHRAGWELVSCSRCLPTRVLKTGLMHEVQHLFSLLHFSCVLFRATQSDWTPGQDDYIIISQSLALIGVFCRVSSRVFNSQILLSRTTTWGCNNAAVNFTESTVGVLQHQRLYSHLYSATCGDLWFWVLSSYHPISAWFRKVLIGFEVYLYFRYLERLWAVAYSLSHMRGDRKIIWLHN